MKRLLSVMAIVLFASLTQGFTVPNNTKTAITGKIIQPNNAKWQHTTWVNPLANVKKDSPSKKSLITAQISWGFDKNYTPSEYIYYRIYVNNVLVVDQNVSGSGSFNVAAGSTVWFNAAFTGGPSHWAFIAYVNDSFNGEIYFKDTPGPVDFTFTAEEGHTYDLFARD